MFLKKNLLSTVAELSTKAIISLIFGSRRDEVTGDWRKLYNEERHIISMMKLRTVRFACQIAWMGKSGIYIEFRWENQKEGGHYEDLDVGGRMVLKMYLK
jgi:hypothetical protein